MTKKGMKYVKINVKNGVFHPLFNHYPHILTLIDVVNILIYRWLIKG